MNHLSSRVQISSLRHHDAGRPAGEFGGLVKIRRRDRERAQVGDEPLLETQGIAAVLVVAAMMSELRSRMAGNPLLIRPFGAFEPVRRLSRPTDERPQEPQWDQKRKVASSHRRTQSPERKRL
jgi:hypothetical protein